MAQQQRTQVQGTIELLLKPEHDQNQNVVCLLVDLTLDANAVQDHPEWEGFQSFMASMENEDDVEKEDDIAQSYNAFGRLLVATLSKNTPVEFLDANSTRDHLRVFYRASPLDEVSRTELLVSKSRQVDLRCDQGGLLGSGFAFIPIDSSDKIYKTVVAWDLSSKRIPSRTRGVWTFGEGPDAIEHVGPVSHVVDSVYMVGKIKSNPPLETPWILPAHYGYYWFGDLPTNIRAIRDIHYDFYTKVSEFFKDSVVDPTYRSFVRSNSKNTDFTRKSFGGTPFTQSQIFDYDDQITSTGDYDLVRLMSHELVRNFLGPKNPDDFDWLFEGISNVLSIYLPLRNGFRTGDYFSSTLSMLCMKYYTSPLIRVPLPELIEHTPVNDYAKEFLAAKAWAFVIACDFRARDISKSTLKLQRPIEDLAIKVLAQKRAKDEPYGIEQWIDLLWPLMGDDVLLKYEAMHQGTITLLPTELFGAKTHKLVYCEQEKLDFGMDRESFDLGIVTNLKPRSRADQAGLIEGDVIVWSTHLQRCVDHFEEEMEVVVMRNGQEHRIRYWPRMHSKADSWKMVKLEEVPDVARLTI